jgi:ribulose-phosphate 3-epimerase
VESSEEIGKVIEHIKAKGMKAGLAIKPKTASSVLYPFIDKIDMALVMVPKPPSPSSSKFLPLVRFFPRLLTL